MSFKVPQASTPPSLPQAPTGITAQHARLQQLNALLKNAQTEDQKLSYQKQIDALQGVIDRNIKNTFKTMS